MNEILKQTLFVNGLIHNADQQVLLVRRSHSDRFLPGYLELPGGRVELGETLEHALGRKLERELGIEVKNPMYYCSLAHVDSSGPYVRSVFEVSLDESQQISLASNYDECVWVDKQQSLDSKLATDARTVLERYLGEDQAITDVSKTTLTINTDGGSRGNPGPSASAFVICDAHGKTVLSDGAYIGITTNNQAEYTAVALALKAATRIAGADDTILFNIDSLLVVNQLNGLYKVKNRELWPINQEIRELMKHFASVRFTHIPREENVAADGKVNEILDQHSSSR